MRPKALQDALTGAGLVCACTGGRGGCFLSNSLFQLAAVGNLYRQDRCGAIAVATLNGCDDVHALIAIGGEGAGDVQQAHNDSGSDTVVAGHTLITSPNTTCLLLRCGVATVVMKN